MVGINTFRLTRTGFQSIPNIVSKLNLSSPSMIEVHELIVAKILLGNLGLKRT